MHHAIINSVPVRRLELLVLSAMTARSSAGNDSRGRSGAGRFLSNFEPKNIFSTGASEALRNVEAYLQALSVADMDLDASTSRVASPSHCRVPYQRSQESAGAQDVFFDNTYSLLSWVLDVSVGIEE